MEALPLITALSAPISTLYDIPGLTQPWYSYNGREIPDRSANLALSAVGKAVLSDDFGTLSEATSARH